MSNHEFFIRTEVEKPDPHSPGDNGTFSLLEIKIDGADITKETTTQQDRMLKEALKNIFWSTAQK